ncbi:unnamed protein product [Acanthoscelides obtectus]|uniref:Uncharacterized protein n=1 Tax=Acanthoscelides obtectus TaxID=200917 RepID=A0A9P0MM27_ACAOB|nr:unnamed protein product [Acanthoscelides obtectus]CAK1677797.1 hypothetical protein AOBTE_LOCUS31563 [Acanthoscelides obtectus]
MALATLASSSPVTQQDSYDSQPPRTSRQEVSRGYKPIEVEPEAADSYLPYQTQLPLQLQVPREQNSMPFITPQDQLYVPEPATDLRAPTEGGQPNYYQQVPVPAQELVAPSEVEWNPNNDPKLYYEVPAVLTRQEQPTKQFPKKYNSDIHTKNKPYSLRPKQELVLEPINERQYQQKQNQLQKTYDRLAKKENQKLIKASQVDHSSDSYLISNNYKVQKPLPPSRPLFYPRQQQAHTRPIPVQNPRPVPIQRPDPDQESSIEYDELPPGSPNDDVQYQEEEEPMEEPPNDKDSIPSQSYNQGLSSELTNSLGIPAGNERVLFHLVGHNGPHSYKFGYDTGKGLNRHFRFEERDNLGLVTGHYGFHDKDGKLRLVRYNADPVTGFHAEGNFGNNEEKN